MIRPHGPNACCRRCPTSIAGRPRTTLYCDPCAREVQRENGTRWIQAKRAGTPHTPPSGRARRLTAVTAELIRETRARFGWSYRRIAEDFGIDVRTAWKYGRPITRRSSPTLPSVSYAQATVTPLVRRTVVAARDADPALRPQLPPAERARRAAA
jgi:hypothetical protein